MIKSDLVGMYGVLSILEIQTTRIHSRSPPIEIEIRSLEASIANALKCLRSLLEIKTGIHEEDMEEI